MRQTLELRGCEHESFGELHVAAQANERTAAAISVGADGPDGARAFKGKLSVWNEDAGGAIDEGATTMLVVADGHRGHLASHLLVARALQMAIPRGPLELLGALPSLAGSKPPSDESCSTLLLATWSRDTRRGFGVSFGDSTLAVLSRSEGAQIANRKNDRYIDPWAPETLDPLRAHEFEFDVPDGGVLVAFSDGIDECCYRSPERSIRPADLIAPLTSDEGRSPESYARELGATALRGVNGHPGGQDNLIVVATRG